VRGPDEGAGRAGDVVPEQQVRRQDGRQDKKFLTGQAHEGQGGLDQGDEGDVVGRPHLGDLGDVLAQGGGEGGG